MPREMSVRFSAQDHSTFNPHSVPREMRNPHTATDYQNYNHYTPSGPQAHLSDKDVCADAWADQGDFPLQLDKVSHSIISARGGAKITFTGENFREGVQVVFEFPRLGVSKVIVPKVLKSTEMEIVAPSLLDWWTQSDKRYHCRELCLSISLLCGGVKGPEDKNTTVDIVAREGLDQPRNVTRSEHLALSVIYMLCDGRDTLSPTAMDLMLKTTEEGQDMLHLAVILGLSTLAREIARHVLVHFQSKPMVEDNVLFATDRNGQTALDFATQLGHEDIEQVLRATLDAAKEVKNAIKDIPSRPLPTLPSPPQSSSSITGTTSPYFGSPQVSAAITPQALHRPLPPTPSLTSSNIENGSAGFSPTTSNTFIETQQYQKPHYLPPSHPPPPLAAPVPDPTAVSGTNGPYSDHKMNTGHNRVRTRHQFLLRHRSQAQISRQCHFLFHNIQVNHMRF
ncbi:hypothetical protein BG004_005477 [Podila humilis]|nr:hypothetical protein BG004_005477 [Podila humilis]